MTAHRTVKLYSLRPSVRKKGPLHNKKASIIPVDAAINRPAILEHTHIGKANIFSAVQRKSEISLKFRTGGQIRPYGINESIFDFATGPLRYIVQVS